MKKFNVRNLVLGLLVVGLLVRVALVVFTPLNQLGGIVAGWFLVDDTYYCLNIAKNIAEGLGWTHDGVNFTNGFQPMYVFAMVPVYWLVGTSDLVTPIYVALIMLAMFQVGCGWWTYKIIRHLTRRERVALLGAVVFIFSPNMLAIGLNGMETAMSLFFVGAALYYYLSQVDQAKSAGVVPEYSFWLKLGLLLGLALWARLDSAILAVAIGVGLLSNWRDYGWKRTMKFATILTAVTVLVYSPFMVAGKIRTGSWVPESGQAVRQITWIKQVGNIVDRIPTFLTDNLAHTVSVSLAEVPVLPNFRMLVQPNGDYFIAHENSLINLVPIGLLLVLLAWYKRRGKLRMMAESHHVILLYIFAMIGIYAFYVFGDHFFYRYMHPVMWCGLILLLSAVACLPRKVVNGFMVVFAMIFLLNVGVEAKSMFTLRAGETWQEVQLQAMNSLELKPGEKLGAFQTGYVSYWKAKDTAPVVNLDGVVNGNAYRAIRDHSMAKYLARENIRYIVDWPIMIQMLSYAGMKGYEYRRYATNGGILTYEVVPQTEVVSQIHF